MVEHGTSQDQQNNDVQQFFFHRRCRGQGQVQGQEEIQGQQKYDVQQLMEHALLLRWSAERSECVRQVSGDDRV